MSLNAKNVRCLLCAREEMIARGRVKLLPTLLQEEAKGIMKQAKYKQRRFNNVAERETQGHQTFVGKAVRTNRQQTTYGY